MSEYYSRYYLETRDLENAMQRQYDAAMMDFEPAANQPAILGMLFQLSMVSELRDSNLDLRIRRRMALDLLEGFESMFGLMLLCLVAEHWQALRFCDDRSDFELMTARLSNTTFQGTQLRPTGYQLKKTLERFYAVFKPNMGAGEE